MGHSTEIGAQDLQTAFHTFNQLSEQLISSYDLLQGRVTELTAELGKTREEKMFELAEKERIANRLTTILTALPAAIVVLDRFGCIQETNPAADEIFCDHVANNMLPGQQWVDVIESAFAPRADDGHDISLKDGRRVNITTNPLESEAGQILLIKDVTQSRALTEQLSRYQKMTAMGEMAAGLAHQVRTPLSTAILYASHLKQTELDTQSRCELVDKVQSQLRHIESMMNDMLMFARGDMAENKPFLLTTLINDLKELTRTEIKTNNIDFSITNELTDHAGMLVGSKEVLLSGLQNMVSNAVQSLVGSKKKTREILINILLVENSFIDIQIIDNGKGVAKEKQDRILEPFFTTRTQGTGLGLAIVDTIAKAHNGCLWFKSTEGEGSTFALRLPLKKNEEAA